MKIIHCSDIHIDSRIDKLPSNKASLRREEVLHSFERMCDFAKQNKVSAVVISGDMFDQSKITKRSLARIMQSILDCNEAIFFYIAGNHDEFVFSDLSIELPSNFKIFTKGFSSFRMGNVVIGGFCFDREISNSFYDNIIFDSADFNILSMHGQIAEYKSKDQNSLISLPMLKEKNIDYLALGHYHAYQSGKLDNRGIYAYSGCLDGRGFDELEQKGFILIDTEKENKYSFIPFSSRVYHVYEHKLSNGKNWIDERREIISYLDQNYSSNDLIKVIVKDEISTDYFIDKEELTVKLNDLFFFVEIEDKTTLKITAEDYLADKTVKGEFLKLVWESNLTDEQKKSVISCGLNALKGEDLL